MTALLVSAADSLSAAEPAGAADPVQVQGYLSAKYLYRTTRSNGEPIRDEDAFTDLRIDLTKSRSNSYEFHFFGTLRDDLSSDRHRSSFSPFEDIGDTYRSRTRGYIYEAHLDFNNPFLTVTQIRIGRQDGTRDEPVFFDGIAADIGIAPWLSVTAYGGAAVNFYDFDSHWSADSLQGIGADLRPAAATLLSLDFLHIDDQQGLYDTESHHDQLVSLKVVQRITPTMRATVKGRSVNGDARDASLRFAAAAPDAGFEVNAVYFRQFRVQNELANDLSPYLTVIGQSDPYQSYDLKARKLFSRGVTVDIGYFQRALINSREEDAFNRQFTRAYGVLDFSDLVVRGFSLALTGEQWKSGQQSFFSTGFDAGYAFQPGRRSPKVNAGSYYSLYKYDYYQTFGERTKVRTNYVKIEYPFAERFAVNGSYEYEEGIEDYQTARLGVRYEF